MVSAINQIVDQLRSAARINALDILKWIGVVQKQALDRSQVLTQTLQKIDTAIEQLLENRARKGQELAQLIEQRLVAISIQVANVRAATPKIIQLQRARLIAKIAVLQVKLDSDRLEQEIVLLPQTTDVDKSLDRLDTRVFEVRRPLKQSGSRVPPRILDASTQSGGQHSVV